MELHVFDGVGEALDYLDKDQAWRKWQVPWAPSRLGPYRIEVYEIPRDDHHRIETVRKEGLRRDPGWGEFRKLVQIYPGVASRGRGKLRELWMSDTRAEIIEHNPMLDRLAQLRRPSRVLVNGLGLGVVSRAALLNPFVEHLDVVDVNQDIIAMVGPHLEDPRLALYCDDAYEIPWPPGTRWDLVWHDIWPEISDENLPGMDKLRRKYKQYVGWQGFWQIEGCRKMANVFRRIDNRTLPVEEARDILEGKFRL